MLLLSLFPSLLMLLCVCVCVRACVCVWGSIRAILNDRVSCERIVFYLRSTEPHERLV